MAKFFQVMEHVFPLPCCQSDVQHCINREMRFAPAQPGSGVVETHDGGETKRARVNTELQVFAVTALQDTKLHFHTVE